MTALNLKIVNLILSIAGLLFSGYLSAVKFLSSTCAFNESCPYFLGYPACYFGFAMFTVIVIYLLFDFWKVIEERTAEMSILAISSLGILFAGYFTIKEIPVLLDKGFSTYFFGLPTCALGLVFFIAILIITLMQILRNKNISNTNK